MIRAELVDGGFIRVAPRGLDLLLKHGRVKRFLRETGWATVGVDPVRECFRTASYQGPERRSTL
ncbi:MAG: GSU3473 family protein [Desulfuromonadales bacterium]